MINIVVPMAGRGSRFAGTPERLPKPLIEVVPGRRMIEYVIDYLTLREPYRFIFVCLAEHDRDFNLSGLFERIAGQHQLIIADTVTQGPVATALLAEALVDNDDELLIAYCDCFFAFDTGDFLAALRRHGADGGVVVYPSQGTMEAYAVLDRHGRVLRTAEKQVISQTAIAGLYYFAVGRDFVAAARSTMAACGDDGEVFVSTIYNPLIADGKTVLSYPIKRAQRFEMGTPEDLALSRRLLAAKDTSASAPRRRADVR